MSRLVAFAAALALLAPAASLATGGSIDSIAPATVNGRPGAEVAVSWTLSRDQPVPGAIEYSCGLLLNGGTVVLVEPTATSATGLVQGAPGSTVTVRIQTVTVTAATTKPENACGAPRTFTDLTFVVPAPPAPPPPGDEPPPPEPAPVEPDPRIIELERELAELRARIEELERLIAELTPGTGNVYEAVRIANATP